MLPGIAVDTNCPGQMMGNPWIPESVKASLEARNAHGPVGGCFGRKCESIKTRSHSYDAMWHLCC